MQVCFGVMKTVGVTSLGIYTGMVATSTVLLFNRPCKEIFGTDVSGKSLAAHLVSRVSKIALLFLTVGSTLLGLSYFKVPKQDQHPYLLYGSLVGPVTFLYGSFFKLFCPIAGCTGSSSKKSCPGASSECCSSDAKCPVSGATNEKSTADGSSHCPFSNIGNKSTAANMCPLFFNISTHLVLLTLVSTAGFAQSVFGLYGEGKLA